MSRILHFLKIYLILDILTLNSPGLAFIARVFRTSKGCVSVVAIAPYQQKGKSVFEARIWNVKCSVFTNTHCRYTGYNVCRRIIPKIASL